MEAILTNIVAAVNDVLWNKYLVLLFLLPGSGIHFTIRTGFVQVRKFGEGMRLVFGNISLKGKETGISSVKATSRLCSRVARRQPLSMVSSLWCSSWWAPSRRSPWYGICLICSTA